MEVAYDVVIAGCGVAGLSATLGAIDAAVESAGRDVSIALLERATKANRGGNTRFSTATFRMKDQRTINDDFLEALRTSTVDADAYIERLAADAPGAVQWAETKGLDFQPGPRVFLTSSDPRIQPAGAGAAIVNTFFERVEDAARGIFFGDDGDRALGVEILYETTLVGLVTDDAGVVTGVEVRTRDGVRQKIGAHAVVLATGGFEGNPEMMTRYVGFDVPPVCRGGEHNRGEGIQMALDIGAKPTGQWNEFHPLPADPRTRGSSSGLLTFAAVMETVPYSVMVNTSGVRFMDEGATSMDYLYDIVGRAVQTQDRQLAYAIIDDKTMQLPSYQTAVSKDKVAEPYQAATIAELAAQIGVDARTLESTIAAYNGAAPEDDTAFDPLQTDALATDPALAPPKSNWARRIDTPPFHAYPVTCSNVFSMGGIGTDERARVVDTDGAPIPGLYAAGEMTGLYHVDYVGSTSVLRGLLFGRVAGAEAVSRALERTV